jgi:hypothetical protein
MRLKANLLAELTQNIEVEVLQLLRKQAGFQGQITFAVPGGTEAVAISLWEKKEHAESYNRETHPQLQKTLEKFIEGPPQSGPNKVINSTFHPRAGQTVASSSAVDGR